jgi:LCP family protein required for cell wall assembly
MLRVRGAWQSASPRNRLLAVAGIVVPLIVIVTVVAVLGRQPVPPPIAVAPSPSPTPSASPTATPSASPSVPVPSPTPSPPGPDPILGTDGRLTVLLLGSDYRPAHPGNRTDAIMVVSVDPSTGKAAAFSVPRDTVGFPLAGGGTFRPKINALYQSLQTKTGDGGRAMQAAVTAAFHIEVDGYVFIGFRGVRELVAAVGGVDVTLAKAYYDPDYWVTAKKQGWGLPAGTSHLGPEAALIFARSRKGDNDFGRARRQQLLVMAALKKARSSGLAKLPTLLEIASQAVRTNLPLDRSTDLFDIVATTDISKVAKTVFGPKTYAVGRGGTGFSLNLAACRAWITANFPPERPLGAWPVASGSPAPSPSGSSSP